MLSYVNFTINTKKYLIREKYPIIVKCNIFVKKAVKMAQNEEHSPLASFFVFDSDVPAVEGATVDILYYYPECKTREEINRRDVEAGISSTFIFFCKQFKPDSPCDYIFTGKREIALQRFDGDIFFCVSIHSTSSTKRLLLKQILLTCKQIIDVSIGPMYRDPKTKKISPQWIDLLQHLLPDVIDVINWKDPVFELLWDAYSPSTSHITSKLNEVNEKLVTLMNKYNMITSIIMTWRDKVITFQGIDPELARILTLLVYHKFKTFFPNKLKRREGRLQWTVGFSFAENGGVQFYSPPVFWKGKMNPLCVLQLNKIRIICLLDTKKIEDINVLRGFTVEIGPLAWNIDCIESKSNLIKKETNFGTNVGVNLHHISVSHKLNITSNKVQEYDYNTIEHGILLADEFSNRFNGTRSGLVPLGNNFFSMFAHDEESNDDYTVMQVKSKTISNTISQFEAIKN